jgi:hypothetical protein
MFTDTLFSATTKGAGLLTPFSRMIFAKQPHKGNGAISHIALTLLFQNAQVLVFRAS